MIEWLKEIYIIIGSIQVLITLFIVILYLKVLYVDKTKKITQMYVIGD